MSAQSNLLVVGIDLCKDFSQGCYYTANMSEPESVSTISDEQKYLIPTVIAKLNDLDEWVIGDDALYRSQRHEAYKIDDIFRYVIQNESVTINDSEFSPISLMKEFIVGLFNLLEKYTNNQKIDKITITVEYPDRNLVDIIRSIIDSMGYDRESVRVIGHSESFIYYTIFQKKELWLNDVIVFDFTKNHFMARKLNLVRARVPQPLIVEEEDFSKRISYDLLSTTAGRKQCDDEFVQIINELCNKHIVSTIFLTGVGFYEKWMEKSVKILCEKRRVFQGYNLFVKGAAYAAIDMAGIGNANDYQFVCSGRTLVDIQLQAIHNDEEKFVMLSKAGTNWYEAGARIEGILSDTNEIVIKLSSSLSKNETEYTLELSEFPERPDKLTRVEISLSYKDDRQCIIVVKDLGFGDFFKTSGKYVKSILNIEEYL